MSILKEIQTILQESSHQHVPVDLILKNGNIIVRSFYIENFDESNRLLTGLTQMEKYAYVREQRDPVYTQLHVEEIKELIRYEVSTGHAT
jgi:hypothetical protein